jgi:hypothetical protein
MIPGTPVLSRRPRVTKAVPWRDRTLRDAIDTVHVHCLILSDTMPMHACAVPRQLVDHFDVYCLEGGHRQRDDSKTARDMPPTSPQHA